MSPSLAQLDVRIVQLPKMKVAAARAVGAAPEIDAWRRLRSWAETQGLMSDKRVRPVYGVSRPTERGYEFFIPVDESVQPDSGIEIREFEGGMFAVATTRLTEANRTWKDLWDWLKESRYCWRRTQEIESVRAAEDSLEMELYLPIQP